MVKKIKTKHGYKIKYSNGTTAYYYPNGTGKRKTKNVAFTGAVKYFHITYGPNEYTNTILKNLYLSGLTQSQSKSAYNYFFKRKIEKKYIKKQYKRLKKQHIKQNTRFKKEMEINKRVTITIKTQKLLNKNLRIAYMQNALIRTSNGVNKLSIFNTTFSKKGRVVIDEFQDNIENPYLEGSG